MQATNQDKIVKKDQVHPKNAICYSPLCFSFVIPFPWVLYEKFIEYTTRKCVVWFYQKIKFRISHSYCMDHGKRIEWNGYSSYECSSNWISKLLARIKELQSSIILSFWFSSFLNKKYDDDFTHNGTIVESLMKLFNEYFYSPISLCLIFPFSFFLKI